LLRPVPRCQRLTAAALAKFATAQASTRCYHPPAANCLVNISRHPKATSSSTQFIPSLQIPCILSRPVPGRIPPPPKATRTMNTFGPLEQTQSSQFSTCSRLGNRQRSRTRRRLTERPDTLPPRPEHIHRPSCSDTSAQRQAAMFEKKNSSHSSKI